MKSMIQAIKEYDARIEAAEKALEKAQTVYRGLDFENATVEDVQEAQWSVIFAEESLELAKKGM